MEHGGGKEPRARFPQLSHFTSKGYAWIVLLHTSTYTHTLTLSCPSLPHPIPLSSLTPPPILQLKAVERQLSGGADNPVLKAERDKLKREVQAKVLAMQSASTVETKRKQLDSEVSGLSEKLMALRDKAQKLPNDAGIRAEVAHVQEALAKRAKQANNLSPKEECYRVCVHPSVKKPASGDPAHVQNCVRMCVKVMRMLVYKMAKKLL